ncbi:MAG TPA: DUF2017 family protein, partial [Chthoniobacterales bacterium]
IDPFFAEIIRQIPHAARPENHSAAEARLFSAPCAENDPLTEDWQEYVVPDLRSLFSTAVARVQHDLSENLCESDGEDDFPYRLQIPMDHLDAWLSALNQARLVLAARYAFSDEELAEHFTPKLTSLRDLALYQITIYGWMQELLLTTVT